MSRPDDRCERPGCGFPADHYHHLDDPPRVRSCDCKGDDHGPRFGWGPCVRPAPTDAVRVLARGMFAALVDPHDRFNVDDLLAKFDQLDPSARAVYMTLAEGVREVMLETFNPTAHDHHHHQTQGDTRA